MADKSFGVKQINLIGASGTPTIESPNNLNLNATTVAISTDVTIGGQVQSDLKIGSSYSVGIGSTDPTAKLDVAGNTELDDLNVSGVSTFASDVNINASLNVVPTSTGIAGLFSGTTSGDMVRITQTGTGNALVVEDSANPDATRLIVDADGNIGIGSDDTNGHNLSLYDSSLQLTTSTEGGGFFTGLTFSYQSAFDSYFISSWVKPLYITGNSDLILQTGSITKVGIGTTDPSQKLHVDGNLRVTGAFYDSGNNSGTSGYVLKSTATGTDWVDPTTVAGLQGIQGITGAQGVQGITGVQGVQGITGAQGITGVQGVQGITGAQGVQGITGAQGIQGISGTSVSIIGSVADVNSTYPGGGPNDPTGLLNYYFPSATTGNGVIDEATGDLWVSNGSGWSNVGNIGGPQGVQGITGAQGVQGIAGPQGVQGITGAQGTGTQGVQGITGAQGAQGVQGITGAQGTGTQGIQGRQGITGAQGTTGAQGIQGITGAQGTGTQGVQGITGAQGVQGIAGSSTTINATNTTTDSTYYPVFVEAAGSNQTASVRTTATAFSFNPSTGTLTVTGDVNSGSDERLKDNIKIVDNSLNIIKKIRGVKFNWIESGKPSIGVIAQDIEKVLPELVGGTDNKTVNYNGIIGVLIEAIKDLKNEIEDLKDTK